MPVWTLLVWLAIGAGAGFVAQKIMGGQSPGGLLGDLVLGIIGALVGGYGLSLLGIAGNGGIIATFIVAVVGAMALIWIVRKLNKA
ncbi:MAG: GlsB/YeaQ/YmgE family stress response membrane protein [Chromatiales bacterium]|nr:GlsB/YeaQ/YmgE family stress response membrane protein [Chromatiales bacterium]